MADITSVCVGCLYRKDSRQDVEMEPNVHAGDGKLLRQYSSIVAVFAAAAGARQISPGEATNRRQPCMCAAVAS